MQALARPTAAGTERVLLGYPVALKQNYGGYYTLGRTFVKLIGNPGFMKFATKHGIKRPYVMRMTMKLLGNLTEPRGGDAVDRVVNALSKIRRRRSARSGLPGCYLEIELSLPAASLCGKTRG